MNEFLKYLKGMKKERATPMRKKAERVEGPLKEVSLKTDHGELREPETLILVKVQ